MLKASLLSTAYVFLKGKLATFVTLSVAVFRNSPTLELTLFLQPCHYFVAVHSLLPYKHLLNQTNSQNAYCPKSENAIIPPKRCASYRRRKKNKHE